MRTGIEYGILLPGLVPPFEEREAAVYCHYTPLEFRELPPDERALCIAQYRIKRMVEMHQSDAVGAEMDRMSRRQQPQ